MQAVILAGGLGTRLRPLTDQVPKVLAPVAGRPFVDWLVSTLPAQVFSEMLLLIGYLGDQVREHCGDGRRYGIPIRYSQEPEPLGTAGALRYAADLLADTFVLLNGDTYIQLDYPDLLAAHERHGTTGTMVLAQPYDPAIPCNVRVEPEGGITRYAKSVLDLELNATDGGVAVFERSLLSHIPDHGPTGLESVVYTSLIALGELSGYVTGGTYYDMGSALGLERLQRVLKPHG